MATIAPAQTGTIYSPASTVDLYGNAQPLFQQRRSVGLYQNPTQQRLLQSYQSYGRRTYRRGELPFSLTGDPRRATDTGMVPFLRSGYPRSPVGQRRTTDIARRHAFEAYGGFGKRIRRQEAGSVLAALDRKHALIAATGINAPIHRAFLEHEGRLVPSSRAITDEQADRFFTAIDESAPTLADRFERRTDIVHQQSRDKAWGLFKEAQYRAAARAFQMAYTLDSGDIESRLGEMFCQLSVGAVRTAVSAFREMLRRDPTPFTDDMNLVSRFIDPREALRVRLQTRMLADATDQPDVDAMHALVLWSMWQHREAQIYADALQRRAPGKPYAAWSALMRSAASSTQREEGLFPEP